MTKSRKTKAAQNALAETVRQSDFPNLIAKLIEASINSHYSDVRKIGTTLAKGLADIGFDGEAKKIISTLRRKGVPLQASGQLEMLPLDLKSKLPLIEETPWPSVPLFLNENASTNYKRLITDANNSSHLSELGLSSRLCMLLVGPPGTGKTLLAGHIASSLKRPFYIARLDSLISSLLGETAKNIRAIFDFIPHKNAVLLLDEIDAIAKIRDDTHELGEIKRVVNTLIQGLDSLDDQTVVIGATNHPHLLDKAIWRRFPYKIELTNPDPDVRTAMWTRFLFQDNDSEHVSKSLAALSEGLSGAEIYELAMQARRHAVINKLPLSLDSIGSLILKYIRGTTLQGSDSASLDEKKDLAHFLCVERGLTQIDAAKLLGVTRQTVAHYLKDVVNA